MASVNNLPPSPFTDSGATPSGGPDEAAAISRSHGPVAAADIQDIISDREIPLTELCARGFDADKFLFAIGCVPEDFAKYMAMMEGLVDHDEPPLFIQEQKRA